LPTFYNQLADCSQTCWCLYWKSFYWRWRYHEL